MLLRRLAWLLGGLLLVGAGVLATTQVEVGSADRSRTCGSVLDVVSGRVDWREWWTADVDEPGRALLRTERCPGAENGRIVLVAGLALGAVVVGVLGEVAHRRTRPAPSPPADPLGTLGRQVTVAGAVLAVVGLAAVGLLVADPDATLFLYVERPVVVLLGALALLPAAALVVAGRALVLLGRELRSRSDAAA